MSQKIRVHPGEKLVGVFVLFAIASLVFLAFKDMVGLFETRAYYHFYLTEGGVLKIGDAVTIQGVNAGSVSSVEFISPNDAAKDEEIIEWRHLEVQRRYNLYRDRQIRRIQREIDYEIEQRQKEAERDEAEATEAAIRATEAEALGETPEESPEEKPTARQRGRPVPGDSDFVPLEQQVDTATQWMNLFPEETEDIEGAAIRVTIRIDGKVYCDLIKDGTAIIYNKGFPPALPASVDVFPPKKLEGDNIASGSMIAAGPKQSLVEQALNVLRDIEGVDETIRAITEQTIPAMNGILAQIERETMGNLNHSWSVFNRETFPVINDLLRTFRDSTEPMLRASLKQFNEVTFPTFNAHLNGLIVRSENLMDDVHELLTHANGIASVIAADKGRIERMIDNVALALDELPGAAKTGNDLLKDTTEIVSGLRNTWPISAIAGESPRVSVTLRYVARPSAYPEGTGK
ncbi:MAG: hypothetical protein NUW37_01255 [Planctomycetes bacterium]|nr:hypothetical protein [Planctomycetota bacterium]